ncbi:kinase-like protein [Penicillium chrysogenum]|nr:kinase-like protein [Penicillium chrysogenum]
MTESPTEVLYEDRNLHKGHRYIKKGNTLLPCPSSVDPLSLEAGQELIHVLDKQMGRIVIEWDASWVTKAGFGVRSAEAEAMRLVSKNTEVPVPEVLFTDFRVDCDDYYSRDTLQEKWDSLDDEAKESTCVQLWDLISKIRNIARPQELEGPYQCAADGSPSRDPMLEDLQKPVRPLTSDMELRARIYERYLHCGGSRYKDRLLDMLPRSERSVFTHADIAPRNVMVDEHNMVTGILDWESAGWYPDYWEYAQIMRPAFWGDWSVWMEKTAPQRWDLEGINASRKVLF